MSFNNDNLPSFLTILSFLPLVPLLSGDQPRATHHNPDCPDIKIMIVGTYHFGNPNQDEFNAKSADVKSPQKQQEIILVVKSLKRFEPHKIAIESQLKKTACNR